MKIIDSHQHFWKVSRGDYTWLTPNLTVLYRDYLPHEFQSILNENNIYGSIAVQAAATVDETHYLLELATHNSFILGVVGWVDMLDKYAPDTLAALAKNTKFLGIRPMIQDITDIDWIVQKELAPCFSALQQLNLTFDALVFPKHLTNLIKLLEKYTDLRIVINHGAKPQIKSKQYQPWATQIKQIAQHPNVYCKVSGLLTEMNPGQPMDDLHPYLDVLFSSFNIDRIMWGSDYPVLNLASSYHQWLDICKQYALSLGTTRMDLFFGKTAENFYHLT